MAAQRSTRSTASGLATDAATRTEEAARELVAMDYTNVRHYDGGKQDWMKHDLPVEGERSES